MRAPLRPRLVAVAAALAGVGLLGSGLVATAAGSAATVSPALTGHRPKPTPTPTPAPTPTPTPTPTPPPPSGFSVVNNVIQDSAGHPWFAHGVDRPSLEWDCAGQAIAGGSGIPASDFQTMASAWHANAVRIPLNQDFWLSATGTAVAPAEQCPSYVTTVRAAVASAEAANLTVILDLHWSDEGNPQSTSVGQKCMADADSIAFWKSVAASFGSDSRVMFELYNEPHDVPWTIWRNGGTFTCTDGVTYAAAGMQQLVTAIRGTGAQNVVIAGGNGWAFDLSGVAGVGPLSGGNVAYATHPYEGSAGDSPSAWDAAFGALAAHAPVVATEFGTTVCSVDAYDSDILTYFRTHGISYTAWAWWAGGCSFPSVISDAAGTCYLGGCTTRQDIGAYASGTQQPAIQPYSAFPPPPQPSTTIRFDFEGGTTQGWGVDYGAGMTAAATAAVAYSGSHSLAVSSPASSYDGVAYKGALTGLSPGMPMTYHVYAPGGAAVSVEPYAADQAWTYHYLGTFALAPGWNTVIVTIPSTWTAINDIGVQVDNTVATPVTIELDAIAWG